MLRPRAALSGLLVGLVALLAACAPAFEDVVAPSDERAQPDADMGGAAGAERDSSFAPQPDADGEPGALPVDVSLPGGDRIIKEGSVSVEVEAGHFDRAFGDLVAVTQRLGGTVAASSTRTAEEGGTSGTVTVRVPVDRYEDLLVAVGGIGTVRSRQVTSNDVTAEYVDLESRLRHLRAQERFFLGLLEEATGISDAIAVQDQLARVQAQVEQAQGRLNYLADRTAFSTLVVELSEPGAAPPAVAEGARPLTAYWKDAVDAFVRVVGTLIVAAGFLLPLVVVGLAALLAWRAGRHARVAPAVSGGETE